MRTVASGLTFQRTVSDVRRVARGYSTNRQSYDARRRAHTRSSLDISYWNIVKHDPCSYCGSSPTRARNGVNDVDHIVGLDQGGEDAWTNYAGACPACNRGVKKDRDLLTTLLALTED